MAEIKLNTQTLAPAAALLITVVIGLGLYSQVDGLKGDVAVLNAEVAQLADLNDRIDAVDLKVAQAEADLASLSDARTEILTELCAILERPPSACGVG